MNLLRSALGISGLTLVSRVTGLVRDMLIARFFGAGMAVDAFAVAFRIPNLLRRLFAEGAFSQAFVPILADVRAREGDEHTRTLFSHVASALFWTLLGVSIAGVAAAPLLVWLMASGFAARPQTFDLATDLTRWMFPYILFMSLVACSAGALNTFRRFSVPAFTPVLLNLSFIGLTLLADRWFDPPVMALAAAVIVGGIAQLAFQVPALARLHLLPRWVGPLRAFAFPGVRRLLQQMLPATFAVSVAQVSLIINTSIASHLGEGSNAWLYYADRLMEFPTALLGVALGTVLLPSLTEAHAKGQPDEYGRLLDWGLRLTVLLAAPAAVGLALLGEGIIAAIFQGRQFGAHDVGQTAVALTGYAAGLLGLVATKILAPGFYAKQDLRTPVMIAVTVLVATQLVNLVLVPLLAHAGLAWSIGLGALANAALLLEGLRRRGVLRPGPHWDTFLAKVAAALATMALVLWGSNQLIEWTDTDIGWLVRVGLLVAVVSVAAIAYFGVLALLGIRPRDFMPKHR